MPATLKGARLRAGPPLPRPLYILFAVRLFNAMGNFVFPFLTMILTLKMGWKTDRAGLFMTFMQAAGYIGVLAGGKLGDSIGRKRSLLIFQLGAALLFLICLLIGIVPILPYLIAAGNFLLQASWPVFNAAVADLSGPQNRKRAFALLYWGNNIGFSIGPLMAGYLFNHNAGLMFAGNATALALTSVLLFFFVPETAPALSHSPASVNGAPEPQTPPSTHDAPGEEAQEGSVFKALAQRPAIIAFALIVALMNIIYGQGNFGLPLFLENRFGEAGPRLFGTAMTINGLTVVLLTGIITAISSKLRPLISMSLAALLYGLGFGMLGFIARDSASGTFLAAMSTVIWTVGEILSATNQNVFVASHSPSSHRSRFNSAVGWISGIGSMLAPFLAGKLMAAQDYSRFWFSAGALGALAAMLMLALYMYDNKKEGGRLLY